MLVELSSLQRPSSALRPHTYAMIAPAKVGLDAWNATAALTSSHAVDPIAMLRASRCRVVTGVRSKSRAKAGIRHDPDGVLETTVLDRVIVSTSPLPFTSTLLSDLLTDASGPLIPCPAVTVWRSRPAYDYSSRPSRLDSDNEIQCTSYVLRDASNGHLW